MFCSSPDGDVQLSSHTYWRVRFGFSMVFGLVALLCVTTTPLAAQMFQPISQEPTLSVDEEQFLRTLIFDLQDTAMARIWIDARLKRVRDALAECTLRYRRADCLRVEGKFDEFVAEKQRIAQQCPNHPESQTAQLTAIQAKMAGVIEKAIAAQLEQDPQRQKALAAERDRLFEMEVLQNLNSEIESISAELANTDSPTTDAFRNQMSWESYRMKAWWIYGTRCLREGSPESRAALEKVVEFAERFVGERDANIGFTAVCDAQLTKGKALSHLGQSALAAEEMEILTEITPPFDPPEDGYPDGVIAYIATIRLQAQQGTAEAYNRSGQPELAVQMFERLANPGYDDGIDMKRAMRDPSLFAVVLQMKLEKGVAYATGHDVVQGLDILQELDSQIEGMRSRDPEAAQGFATLVDIGWSRLIEVGLGTLTPRQYFRAGVGFKNRQRFFDALDAWKLALDANADDDDFKSEALFQIAETTSILGYSPESGLAYFEYCETFPRGKQIGRAAQNAFAILGEVAESEGGAWLGMTTQAERIYKVHVGPEGANLIAYAEGIAFEQEGQLRKARESYLKVVKEFDRNGRMQPAPRYYEGRSSAARTLHTAGKSQGFPNGEKDAAIAELAALEAEARAEGDSKRRGVGLSHVLLELARIHYASGEGEMSAASDALKRLGNVSEDNDAHRSAISLWVTIAIAQNDLKLAEEKFAILRRVYPNSTEAQGRNLDLVDAHQGADSDIDTHNRRAAELVLVFMSRDGFNAATLPIAQLRWFADALIRGGKYTEARELLEIAKSKLNDESSEDERIGVTVSFAKANYASRKYQDAFDALKPLFDAAKSGGLSDGPEVLILAADSLLKLNEAKPDRRNVSEAEECYIIAINILKGRYSNLDKAQQRDYWQAQINFLQVEVSLKQFERVVKWVNTLEITYGKELEPIPADLRSQFLRLRTEAKK